VKAREEQSETVQQTLWRQKEGTKKNVLRDDTGSDSSKNEKYCKRQPEIYSGNCQCKEGSIKNKKWKENEEERGMRESELKEETVGENKANI